MKSSRSSISPGQQTKEIGHAPEAASTRAADDTYPLRNMLEISALPSPSAALTPNSPRREREHDVPDKRSASSAGKQAEMPAPSCVCNLGGARKKPAARLTIRCSMNATATRAIKLKCSRSNPPPATTPSIGGVATPALSNYSNSLGAPRPRVWGTTKRANTIIDLQ